VKSFDHDIHIRFGKGKGDGHDHLCLEVEGVPLCYFHLVRSRENTIRISCYEVSESKGGTEDIRDISSEEIEWIEIKGFKDIASFTLF